jgi:hypothetical protein
MVNSIFTFKMKYELITRIGQRLRKSNALLIVEEIGYVITPQERS